MKKLLSFLVLPPAISAFEERYLARLNRVWLAFFWAMVPLIMAVAAACGTGAKRALLFTGFLLAGTTLAARTIKNPRRISLVFGFTAMAMGGLLVHFGQGPMQIEMHFSFFALIACLAVFGNPMTIVAAAVTVALHHLIIWAVLPSSVFNYQASFWVVAVHAAFVVVESVAACFIARSFFDNVIGLEKIVTARTAALRLLLDNAEQGFVRVSREGVLGAERSRVVDEWLHLGTGAPALWDAVARLDADAADWLRVSWPELWADVLPLEMAIDQLPHRMRAGDAVYSLGYKPLLDEAGRLSLMLVIIGDVTAEVARERAEAAQREMMQVFERVTRDRPGFLSFFRDADEIVARLTAGAPRPVEEEWRDLHTLKGNCAVFGVTSMVDTSHHVESLVLEERRGLLDPERQRIADAWRDTSARLAPVVGEPRRDVIEITASEQASALSAIQSKRPTVELVALVRSWSNEPTQRRLERLADAAQRVAERLGKGPLTVTTEHNQLRVDEGMLGPVWSALPHLVRNAIDHGLESREERAASGKAEPPRLLLRTRIDGERFVIEVSDNGRGIDWGGVAERARRLGLPSDTRADLVEALFADGLTTRDEVTDISGRGVGLAAVRAACRTVGGRLTVQSEPGSGARFEIEWPAHVALGAGATNQRAA